ncbi:CHAP domain-containing protein [Rathayibacter toxicus]|uniref:CHAP domain-containing protein n=1 Tax=Rathayibacter toxicus TaxID=145458 RepID=A0A2S5Y9Q7_9MICO|nr:CHAP domain-containing protein [Rathayibacter toxicus]PPG48098.1 CHAP domain-containing protein [Rathayibacter toxicus]PPH25311.1 CHAP domain-containing protein [Rathayibacter toxicus]PPH58557.1 CHAP domain-containing protein [Rathayibacter toxicus]PPH61185.1 CHAP domain-containing protein [Rathayibacter toxicus]
MGVAAVMMGSFPDALILASRPAPTPATRADSVVTLLLSPLSKLDSLVVRACPARYEVHQAQEIPRVSKPDIPAPKECPGTSSPHAPAPVYLTRREARAAEARAIAQADAATSRAEPTPPSPISLPAATSTGANSGPLVDSAPRTTSEPTRSRSLSRRALGLATFSVVGGLFATTAIPAYGARGDAGVAKGTARRNELQNLTVSADASAKTAVRDAFAAPTQAQLDEASRQAAVLSGSRGGQFSTVQTRATGDDYPWPYEKTDTDGGGLSPLGYYYRECVDFVAWRLNRDAGRTSGPWKYTWSVITPHGGSAYEWPDNWAAKGWATSSVPIVGCVAWWRYNHVSYVQKVNNDGTVLLEEYNYGGKHSYVTRTFPTAQVPLFLYPPAL